MKLISMKYTPAEQKEETAELSAPEASKYPWGLELCLDDEQLKKLNLSSPQGEYTLLAKVKVTRTSSNTDDKGESESSANMQITEMALSPVITDAADKLWPGK